MSESLDIKSTSALERVPILESDNWAEFHRRAEEYIILAGYDDVYNDEQPEQPEIIVPGEGISETEEARAPRIRLTTEYAKVIRTYNARMKRACTAIRSRLNVNNHAMVENITVGSLENGR